MEFFLFENKAKKKEKICLANPDDSAEKSSQVVKGLSELRQVQLYGFSQQKNIKQ